MSERIRIPDVMPMDRNLALKAVRVTEAAALAVAAFIGKGDDRAADPARRSRPPMAP